MNPRVEKSSVAEASSGYTSTPTLDSGRFTLTLGDVSLCLRSADRSWLRQAAQRYGAFVADNGSSRSPNTTWQIDYEVCDDLPPTPEALCQARQHGLHMHSRGRHREIVGQGFRGAWDPEEQRAELTGPRAVYAVDLLVQAVWYACQPTSLILHAAAVHDGGQAWLCAGPSGSGKSTLARLFPDHAVSDELVGIVGPSCKPEQGHGFELVALPFWSARPGRFSLAAVHCIGHRLKESCRLQESCRPQEPHQRRRLGSRQSVAGLRGQVAWPTWDEVTMGHCLNTLGQLIETVPIYALAFSPQADVWPLVVDTCGARP